MTVLPLVALGIVACSSSPTAPLQRHPAVAVRGKPSIKGRILLDGQPVSYFGVAVMKTFAFLVFNVATPFHPSDGRFEMYAVNNGIWDLVVVGPEFGRELRIGVTVEDDKTVDLGDIAVQRGWTIRGRVTRSDGAPVSNAKVEINCDPWMPATDELTSRSRGCYRGRSQSDGSYVISNVKKVDPIGGTSLRVGAFAGDEVSFSRYVPEHESTIDLVVRRAGRVVAKVKGTTTPDLVVIAHALSRNGDSGFGISRAADGVTFQIERLAPGDYDVFATGSDHREGPKEHITVRSDETTTVTLTPPEPAAAAQPQH